MKTYGDYRQDLQGVVDGDLNVTNAVKAIQDTLPESKYRDEIISFVMVLGWYVEFVCETVDGVVADAARGVSFEVVLRHVAERRRMRIEASSPSSACKMSHAALGGVERKRRRAAPG